MIVPIVLGIGAALILISVASYFWSNYHISKKEIAVLCREISIMLDAGIPLLRVFKILSGRISHPRLRSVITEVHNSVENGNTVAAAMASHPDVFDDMMIGIIKVGETGGILDESMRRLSTHLEKWIALRRKVVLAWIYPVMVITVLMAVVVTLVVFFVPNVIDPLIELNPDLEVPMITLIVKGFGDYVINHWLFLIVAIVVALVGISFLRRTPPVKEIEDRMKLRFPVLGKLIGRPIVASSVSGTFSTLIHSGIPVISCLKILSQTQTNRVVARSLQKTAQFVEEGGSIVTPMEESKIYPPLMIDMLAVGDESGTLDTVLEKISETFTEEVDSALDAFTRILEAVVMLLVGAVVLIVALAAYLPYFTMYTKLDM